MRSVFPVKKLEQVCAAPEPKRGVWARNIWIDNTCAYIGIGIKPEDSEGGFEMISEEEAVEFANDLLRRVELIREKRKQAQAG